MAIDGEQAREESERASRHPHLGEGIPSASRRVPDIVGRDDTDRDFTPGRMGSDQTQVLDSAQPTEAVLACQRPGTRKDAHSPHVCLPGTQLVLRKPALDPRGVDICVQHATANESARITSVAFSRRTHRRLFNRAARWCQNAHQMTKVPRWENALLACSWRSACLTARAAGRGPQRWISKVIHWRNATYRETSERPRLRRFVTKNVGRLSLATRSSQQSCLVDKRRGILVLSLASEKLEGSTRPLEATPE